MALSLTILRSDRGDTVTVVAKLGDDELHRDKLDLNRADARSKFARAINKLVPRFTAIEVDSQLVKLLADLERKRERENDEPQVEHGEELDAMEMTRPELIIRRDFSAIVVPRLMRTRNGPDGVWTLYSKSKAKRSASELEPSVIVSEQVLHVSPMPYPPTVSDASELCRWSQASREAWIRGEVAPTTDEAITAIMERLDRFIELPSDPADGEAGSIGHAATLSLWVLLPYCGTRTGNASAPCNCTPSNRMDRVPGVPQRAQIQGVPSLFQRFTDPIVVLVEGKR